MKSDCASISTVSLPQYCLLLEASVEGEEKGERGRAGFCPLA